MTDKTFKARKSTLVKKITKDAIRKEKPIVLEEIINPTKEEVVIATFNLKQIVWKSGQTMWNIMLAIHGDMNEAFVFCKAKFVFNEEPFLDEIKHIEQQIAEIERTDSRMFDGMSRKQIDNLTVAKNQVSIDLQTGKANYPDIEFNATAVKIDWTSNVPNVTFAVNSEFVEKLNREKLNVGKYKIELRPLK